MTVENGSSASMKSWLAWSNWLLSWLTAAISLASLMPSPRLAAMTTWRARLPSVSTCWADRPISVVHWRNSASSTARATRLVASKNGWIRSE
jgi:hypothetical protein